MSEYNIRAAEAFGEFASRCIKQYIPEKDFMVAGGCLRDVLLGRDVTDIDVLVRNAHTADMPGNVWEHFCGTDDDNRSIEMYSRGVLSLGQGATLGGYDVELFMREHEFSVSDCFEYHVLNLSNVAYYKGELIIDQSFKDCVRDEVLYSAYIGGDARLSERDSRYVTKVQNKYDWPLRSSG